MKSLIKLIGTALTFLLLILACTHNNINIDTIQNAPVAIRSTQADCDTLQMNLPPLTPPLPCVEIAELLECRLNQGIDEDTLSTACDDLLGIYMDTLCLKVQDLVNNPQKVVKEIKIEVMNNVGTCPGPCINPDPITGCASILFQVSAISIGGCNIENECSLSYQARVCCN